jgi:lipopolysaccharide biosynthesis protein
MKSAILLHLYYQDLWLEFKEKIAPILNKNTHLYVSVNTLESEYIDDIKKYSTDIFLVENKGMDVAPFIYVYNKIKDKDYSIYLKLHSKKSLHTPNIGDNWRKLLYYPIVDNYINILEQVKDTNQCFMLGVEKFYHDMNIEPKHHPNKLSAKFYIDKACDLLNIIDEGSFFAGTMFMVNDLYLKTLFKNIDLEKFYNEFEKGYLRDSLAHGMERVIGYGINHYKGVYYVI